MPALRGRFLIALSIVAALAAASTLSGASYPLGPTTVRVDWRLALSGSTHLSFPPLGEAYARTHRGPTRLQVTLQSIDPAHLRRVVDQSRAETRALREVVTGPIVAEAKGIAWRFVLRSLLIGALAGAVAALIFALKSSAPAALVRDTLTGAGVGASTVLLAAGVTWLTFNPGAFERPVYRGALESVPWLIELVQAGVATSAELEERLATLSVNLNQMYQSVEGVLPPLALTEADVKVLHVTDFHNHPAAARVTFEIAHAFDVDFIINTGDLTEFGTFLETDLLSRLEGGTIPHYFVSGNHESPELLQRIELMESVTLIDGEVVREAGLTIMGVGDPGAAVYTAYSLTPTEARRMADQLNQALSAMAPPVDILAVHNFRVAEGIRPGLVPLIVYGHSHTPGVTFREGTAYVNAGTTGGAGIRGIEAPEPVRLSLAVIYIKKEDGSPRVVAVDLIRLSPVAGGFVMERFLAPR